MTTLLKVRLLAFASAFAMVALPDQAFAQICHGTPGRGGIAYERGLEALSTSHGASATFAGNRTAFNINASVFGKTPENTSRAAGARFSMQFHANRLAICPGLGLGYGRNVWTVPQGPVGDVSITTHAVALRPGVAVGLAQPVFRGVTLIPSLGVKYAYKVWYLSSKSEGDVFPSGDTASVVEIEYGLTAQYRNVYLGWSALRDSDSDGLRPIAARFFLGITWGVGRKE